MHACIYTYREIAATIIAPCSCISAKKGYRNHLGYEHSRVAHALTAPAHIRTSSCKEVCNQRSICKLFLYCTSASEDVHLNCYSISIAVHLYNIIIV